MIATKVQHVKFNTIIWMCAPRDDSILTQFE